MHIMLLLSSFGWAEDPLVSQGEIPYFNAQAFRPAIDSHQFIWLNDTSLGKQGTFNYRSTFSYASSPVIYKDFWGNETSILKDISQIDVSAGFTQGRVRYAITAPIILNATGNLSSENAEMGLGEALADVKIQLLDRNEHRTGISVTGRSSLPTSNLESPVGTDGFLFEIESGLDVHLGQSTFAFNIGHRHQPEVHTESITWGSQLYTKTGYAIPFTDDKEHGMAIEHVFSGLYSKMQNDGISQELMLSGWFSVHHALQFRLGFSKGLSMGMTTPDWRGVAAISILHHTEKDSDGDGIVDHEDLCVDEREDVDGFEDQDGCPEPTKVNVLLMDHMGHEVRDAHWHSTDERFSGPGHSSFLMQGGTIELDVDDPKYESHPMSFVIRDQAEQNIFLEVELVMGSLKVIIFDENDQLIPNATWSIDGIKGALFQPVDSIVPLKPGIHELVVTADGFKMLKKEVNIKANQVLVVHLQTEKSRVTRNLDILEKIYFKTASAEIDERSHTLLDEVAIILDHYHLIEEVQIEGHTDNQGDDVYNKNLSQARADAVRSYLIEKGVEEERLISVGFGEERPIESNDTDEGRASNRRVVFHITKKHGDDVVIDSSEKESETEKIQDENKDDSLK